MTKSTNKKIYQFEDYRLDAAHLLLYRHGEEIPLAPKVVETLLTLVENRGKVLSTNEMMQLVWTDSIVEENNLSQNLFRLRKVLGDTKDGKPFIETLRRRGYRFASEVSVVEIDEEVLSSAFKQIADENSANEVRQIDFVGDETNNKRKNLEIVDSDNAKKEIGENQTEKLSHSLAFNKEKRTFFIAGVVATCGLVILLSFAWSNYRNTQSHGASPSPNITLKRLTPSLSILSPTISFDGKYLAYGLAGKEGNSIWLKDLANGNAVQLLPPIHKAYRVLQFSPDATQIYYLTRLNDINRVPTSGGSPQEIAQDAAENGFTISPDGKQIAFVRGKGLVIANTDGSGERVLAERNSDSRWFASNFTQPSWSPDANRIVISGGYTESGRRYAELLEIAVADGKERRLVTPEWEQINNVAWLSDGTGMLVTARERLTAPLQIWHLSYPNGVVSKITNDLHSYGWLSLTADSRTLVTEELSGGIHIWVGSPADANRVEQVTFNVGETAGKSGLAFMPDGKIVYNLAFFSVNDLWIMNPDGNGQRPLTEDFGFWNARHLVTPDGRYIVFISGRSGIGHIWRIDTDGSNLVQLSNGKGEDHLSLSPDGEWIYYTDNESKIPSIWKISINGGEPRRVSGNYWASTPSVSPDGRLIAYSHGQNSNNSWKMSVMSAESGESLKTFDAEPHRGIMHWTADSKAIIYIANKSPNLWQQPIDGSPPVQLTDFNLEETFNFAISPDYQKIAIVRGSTSTEAVMINNFK